MIRRLISLAGLALLLSALVPTSSGAGSTSEPAEITGTGAWTAANQLGSWGKALYDSEQGMNISYLAKGSPGRELFAKGEADFAISGFELDHEDLATLAARKVTAISAPISVGSAAFLMSAPYPSGLRTFDTTVDPDAVDPFAEYHGGLRLPNTTVSRIFLDRGVNNWYEPEFIAANSSLLPAGVEFAPVINPTLPVVRSDGSATNYFLQQFVQKYTPADFLTKVAESQLAQFEISESWPFLYTGSRAGAVNAATLVSGWQSPKDNVIPYGGAIAAVPASEALRQKVGQDLHRLAGQASTPLFIPEIQNAAGEWVAPTPESISLAIEQGDGAPLAAMNTPIPGAYPLAWVNRFFAPASGLSIDVTNGLATFVRYSVTAGQQASADLGEGRLSGKLVLEALAAADQIVAGNCVGKDRKVISAANGGSLWPTGVAMPVAAFTVCAPVSDPAPAVAATPPTASGVVPTSAAVAGLNVSNSSSGGIVPGRSSSPSSGVAVSRGSSSGASYSSGALDAVTPADASFTEGAEGDTAALSAAAGTGAGESATAALASATLPLKMPDDGRGSLDRLTTMLLGGLLLIVGRGMFRRSKVAS